METALITHETSTRITVATWRGRTTETVEPNGVADAEAHAAFLRNLGVVVTLVVAP